MVGAKEDRYEGQPDNTGGVHGEPNVPGRGRSDHLQARSPLLGLIEVFRNLPRLDGLHRAEEDQDHVVHLHTL